MIAAIALLVFIRPFISEVAFPEVDFWYRMLLLAVFLAAVLRKRYLSKRSQIDIAIILFLLACAASWFFSINKNRTFTELQQLFCGICLFFLAARSTQKEAGYLARTLCFAAVIASLYGVYQYIFGFERLGIFLAENKDRLPNYPQLQDILFRKRVYATFVSPDMLGGYLLMVMPISLGLAVKSRGRARLLYAVIIAVLLTVLILTRSIGALLTAALSSLAFLALQRRFAPRQENGKNRLGVFFLALVVIAFLLITSARLGVLFDPKNPHNPAKQRLDYWRSALGVIKDFPALGVGLGNFGIIYPKYKLPDAGEVFFAHNGFLQIWTEAGGIGVLTFLIILVIFMRSGFAALKKRSGDAIALGVFVGGIAFLLHNLIDYDLSIYQVSFHWWVIAGLMCALLREGAEECNVGHIPTGPMAMAFKIAVSALVIAAASFMAINFLSYLHYRKAYAYVEGKEDSAAASEIRYAIALNPQADGYHFFLAKLLERSLKRQNRDVRVVSEVISEHVRAMRLSPYYSFYYASLARFYLSCGKPSAAIALIRQALRLYPCNREYKALLAAIDTP